MIHRRARAGLTAKLTLSRSEIFLAVTNFQEHPR